MLLLGGTIEARRLGGRLAGRTDISAILSLAGRTDNPVAQPLPVRRGGFGGAKGLERYLREEGIGAVIDATHPYAAAISRNAASACAAAGVPLLALRRAPWVRQAGDLWREVEDIPAALAALGDAPRRVFLALGRNEVRAFEAAPQHSYLVRSVDPVMPPLDVPEAAYVVARGPFAEVEERDLLAGHRIELVVAKNSGGDATYAKMKAARALGIEVLLLRRPVLPQVEAVEDIEAALAWLERVATGPTRRS